MARFRTIKPQFFSSAQVVECSPTARLLFVGLWCFCDDGGVHPASAARLKMEVFPADPFSVRQIEEWLSELHKASLIETYRVNGKDFWRVTGWQHQRIDKPTYSYPLSQKFGEEAKRARRSLDESSPPERKGAEGSGAERSGTEWSGESISGWKADGSAPPSGQANGHPRHPSHPPRVFFRKGEAADLTDLDWSHVCAMAEAVGRKIRAVDEKDRRAWLRYAVLAATAFSEAWLMDSVDAVVNAKETKRSRQAHFVGVLKAKALELGFDKATYAAMLGSIEIPADVWKSGVLETRR